MFLYILAFLCCSLGLILLCKITPENIGKGLSFLFSGKETLKEKVNKAKRKKKKRGLKNYLKEKKLKMQGMGYENLFYLFLVLSIFFIPIAVLICISLDNFFLLPFFLVFLPFSPFYIFSLYEKQYEKKILKELEITLSLVTTSYLSSENLLTAVGENLMHMKGPLKRYFSEFLTECTLFGGDIKGGLYHLSEKYNHAIFFEWCMELIACQEDIHKKENLQRIVDSLSVERLGNSEVEPILKSARMEYFFMVLLLLLNIPLLYFINKDWYFSLVQTTLGKFTLGLVSIVVLVTFFLMEQWTKPLRLKERNLDK